MPTRDVATPAMDALLVAIDRFCEHPLPETGPELAFALTRFRHGIDLLELRFSEFAAAFAATDEYDCQGSVSPIHWIRLNCHMGGGAAADRVAVGTHLTSLPESVETMAEGDIGFAHLAMIARTATAISEESARPFDEARFSIRRGTSASAASGICAATRATRPTPRAMRGNRPRAWRRGR